MCKRHTKGLIGPWLILLSAAVCATTVLPSGIKAQGGEGRSAKAAGSPARTGTRPRRRSRPPVARRITVPEPAPAATPVRTGSLALIVSERGSQVFLSRIDGNTPAVSAYTPLNSRPLVMRGLEPGTYKLQIKKYGFSEELRNVSIASGKRRLVRVNLLPKMSVLSISSNVNDADIEIEKVAKFNRPVKQLRVRPGVYRINVRRRGYVPQTTTVDLKLPGKVQDLKFVLQPLPVDSVLARANEKINSGELREAAALTNDLLKLNAAHSRANLLSGMTAFHKGDLASSSQLLKAAGKNEIVRLPVTILDSAGGTPKLVEAELLLMRNQIEFKTAGRVQFNFRVARPEISELSRGLDSSSMTFITIRGRGESYGRPLDQRLTIYSGQAAVRPNREIFCKLVSRGRSCSSDIDIIHKLLSGWRSSSWESAEQ